ncbi:hypothetical protein EKO04_004223 [Ascochyta lentis]|uniref:Uncharacterized protein n=1 Tax=Ascochyta lentis TaxID=205686 RepID=A0A8H7MEN1_9PLEO|nr:hypothetical protein EKO04_004223 [Ascochyta lentis]
MSSSALSAPTLYTPSDLKNDPELVNEITNLVNDAFYRSKLADPVKWRQARGRRFPTNDLYFEMLGQEGVVVAIFDNDAGRRKVVAVAAAVPWEGGWKKEGAGVEDGWEIKAVAVDGSAQYLRRGLAVKMYSFLEQCLVSRTRESGLSTTGRRLAEEDHLTFWILAAECINGVYWKKRGYEIVRQDTYGPPTWGCQTSFEMIVLRKNVPLTTAGSNHLTEMAIGNPQPHTGETVKAN